MTGGGAIAHPQAEQGHLIHKQNIKFLPLAITHGGTVRRSLPSDNFTRREQECGGARARARAAKVGVERSQRGPM